VGKSDSSMDALAWTLKHAVTPSTIVYLVHVFLETWYIPSPCKLSLDLSLSFSLSLSLSLPSVGDSRSNRCIDNLNHH
jgi:hypothetical protein